nr:MAG TPA: cytochrome oxidase subunit II [Caudoviricetes sp.]
MVLIMALHGSKRKLILCVYCHATSGVAPYTNVIYWITKKPPRRKPRRQFRKGKQETERMSR